MKKSIMSLSLAGTLALGSLVAGVGAKTPVAIMISSTNFGYEETIIAHAQNAAAKSQARNNMEEFQVTYSGEKYSLKDLNNAMENNPGLGLKEAVESLKKGEEGLVEEDYDYRLISEGKEVEITGYTGDARKLIIPANIENKPVTSIGVDAFTYNHLESVKIPDGVTSIGAGAFSYNYLESVEIPNGLTRIETGVFAYNQLKSLKISDGVTSIGADAFSNNQLKSVKIPDGVIRIRGGAFSYNHLESVKIPDGIINIESSTFFSNHLESVEIPAGVVSIEATAFYDNKLTSVEIPAGVTRIGGGAFSYNQENPKDFTIYGEKESRAESYASEYKYTFKPIKK